MRNRTRLTVAAMIAMVSLSGRLDAEDPLAREATEAVAGDVMAIINVVLAEHFSPPTKQEMVSAAIRAWNPKDKLATAERIVEESKLANAISRAVNDQELHTLLSDFLQSKFTGVSSTKLTLQAADAIFAVVPGGGRAVEEKDHLVNEQIAANRYVGIGIALKSDNGWPVIASVIPGGPCDRASIAEDTFILAIDGWSTEQRDLSEIVDRLRGPEGTQVVLAVRSKPDSEQREIQLTRGVVPFKNVKIEEHERDGQKVAVLEIVRLTPSVPHELRAYASQSEALVGVVIDLSSTESGNLHNAVLAADALLDDVPIGSSVTVHGTKPIQLQPEALFQDVPMIVIIGPGTYGTVEWLAAALAESGRAALYGAPSAGAAVSQESFRIPSGRFAVDIPTGVLLTQSQKRLMASVDEALSRENTIVVQEHGAQRTPTTEKEITGRLVPMRRDSIEQVPSLLNLIVRTPVIRRPATLGAYKTGVDTAIEDLFERASMKLTPAQSDGQ